MKKQIWIVLVIHVAFSALCGAEEPLPSLPEPDFELSNTQSFSGVDGDSSAPDLLRELEDLLETPSKRDAKAQLKKSKVEPNFGKYTEKKSPRSSTEFEEDMWEEDPFFEQDEKRELTQKKGFQKTELDQLATHPEKTTFGDKIVSVPNESTGLVVPKKNRELITLDKANKKSKMKKKSVTKKIVSRARSVTQSKKQMGQLNALRTRFSSNGISAVDFFEKDGFHVLELTTHFPIDFKLQTKKKAKQLIYTFPGISIPAKLQRAYETREFKSPVAMYTLGRIKRRGKWFGQLLIQMRELVLPQIIKDERHFSLQFPNKVDKLVNRKLANSLPESFFGTETFTNERIFSGAAIEKLELKNTEIGEALKLVLQPSGYNVIISEEVKGEVGNLSLSDTPWDQAFYLLLKMKGLGYVLRGNVIQIAPTSVLQQARELAEKQEETEPLRTVMIPISYAKAGALAPRAQAFLTKRGKVDVDDRTNTIIIRDTDSIIKRIQKIFSILDTQPPAVSISAKFVELKKEFGRNLGLGRLTLAGQTSGINFGAPEPPSTNAGFIVNPGGTINLSAPKFAALNAELTIGENDRQVKVLANPTITVQQGQKGSISQGKTTDIPQQATAQGAITTSLSQTANLSLNVTPIVANDGSISLDTNLLQEIPQNIGNTLSKDTRQIQTQIILKNGDTAVLGGVFAGTESNVSLGLPLLRKLPILSFFFSSQTELIERNEVLIFITARILNPESAFKQSL